MKPEFELALKKAVSFLAKSDRFEAEELEFHQKLRAAYHALVKIEPQRCVLIDATAEPDTVAATIWAAVRDRLFPARADSAINPA